MLCSIMPGDVVTCQDVDMFRSKVGAPQKKEIRQEFLVKEVQTSSNTYCFLNGFLDPRKEIP